MSEPNSIAPMPQGDYYAVIFTSEREERDDGYEVTAERMVELAGKRPGFLGIESARSKDGLGVTVSYWRDEESIATWKAELDHLEAQRRGREGWYDAYAVRVARVVRSYRFPSTSAPGAEGTDTGR